MALALAAAPAKAEFQLGINDGEYVSPDATVRAQAFDHTVAVGADLILITAPWSSIAPPSPSADFAPTDPGDPAYSWGALDEGVRDAVARGLEVVILVTRAPVWAEGPGRPGDAPAGTWQPDPGSFGEFAAAASQRYSGGFTPPGSADGPLPRVRYWQAWSEPNLATHLSPQWSGRRPEAPAHYRLMLNAFYDAVKGADPGNLVLTAGTAPYGNPPGSPRMRPLVFWRGVLCLRKRLQPSSCDPKPRFDILAHHPINTSGGPRRSAVNPDDASTPDFKHVRRTLRAAERAGNAAGAARHQLWATELWWESDPPDRVRGVSLRKHARWIEEAIYLLWKQGAKAVVNLGVADGAFNPDRPLESLESGLFFRDGAPKPAAQAFRFPFVTERRSKRVIRAWGRAPVAGSVAIEKRTRRGWRGLGRREVGEHGVFRATLRVRGKARLRARVGGETSLPWRQDP